MPLRSRLLPRPRRLPRPRLLLAMLVALALPASAPAQFQVLETPDLRLIYDEVNLGYLSSHTARCFTNSLRFHRRLFGYQSEEKITLILNDFSDYGNAGAGATPRNSLMVGVAPTSVIYETYPANERINTLMNHELVHIVALDQTSSSERFYRGLFGGKVAETSEHPETILYSYLTAPRASSPRWYHEGAAVFLETWMAGGYGRALGAYDEMVFRAKVRDGSRIYDPLGLESEGTTVDFQAGVNSYLYGTRFITYLAYRYSPEAVVEWVGRAPGSRRYYGAQFRQVFKSSLEDVWKEWVAWERGFQASNLAAIREYPVTPHRDVTVIPLGSVSRPAYDPATRTFYAAVNYPGEVAHLAAISVDSGKIRRLHDVKGPALFFVSALAHDARGNTLFYTTDNNDYRDVCALDLATGKSRILIKDGRIGELAFDAASRTLWGIRHYNGIATLVKMPEPFDDWQQVHSWPYGQFLYDIDVSPDGRKLSASVAEVSGRQTLRVFDLDLLADGDTTAVTAADFGAALPGTFVFSPDGRYLFGTTYYTGVSNVFRYEMETGALEAVSNCETGFFRPVSVAEDSLLVFRYSGEGFVPCWIDPLPLQDINPITFLGQKVVEEHPVVRDWTMDPPGDVDLEPLVQKTGSYHAWRSLEVESVHPVVQGYKDYPSYGLRLNLSDPLSLNRFDLTAGYTPNSDLPEDERIHARLRYRRYDLTVTARHNAADFYDLFGPVKTGRKGYSLGAVFNRTLLHDGPRNLDYAVGITGYGGLETVPDYQNVGVSDDRLLTGFARVSYRNLRFSLGAVDYEKGHRWQVLAGQSLVADRGFPNISGNFDFGFPLPVSHTSIWFRQAAGYSPGDRDEPFANFYFGGFGNNWVDHSDPKRFRDSESFPGLELNEVGGTTFYRQMVELNLPPLRFRRVGLPSLYATWARLTFFGAGLTTNYDDEALRRTLGDAGAQVDIRVRMLSRLNLTVSAGYAAAFEKGFRPRDEFMFSVKIL